MSDGPESRFDRYRPVLTVLLVIAVVGGVVVFLLRQPPPTALTILPPPPTGTPAPTLTPVPSPTPGPIQVYVTGAVVSPQSLLSLPYGSRVIDAITAAGGFADNADRDRVNLAQILRNGDQVHVYALPAPEAPQTAEIILPTPNDSGIVYINRATLEELDSLPGIGPALAQRIIDYRQQNGPFADLAALDNVSGIGPAILEDIAPLVSFDNP